MTIGFLLFLLLFAPVVPAAAQIISIRTVPIYQADRFDIFPSRNSAMAGVSFVLPDTLLDPSVNPAMGVRLGSPLFFTTPTLYAVTLDAGGGGAMPMGVMGRRGNWFGTLAGALQQVNRGFTTSFRPTTVVSTSGDTMAIGHSGRNEYSSASLGRLIGPGTSIAVGGSWGRLTAVDAAEMLFSGSQGIQQSGHVGDLRVGFLKEWSGANELELLALYNTYAMTDQVAFLDNFWDPVQQRTFTRLRVDGNRDRTDTWGLRAGYRRPLIEDWRIGWSVTGNRMRHPDIPDYNVTNTPAQTGGGWSTVPWDPGYSWAYDLGVGVGRLFPHGRFGADLVYEPIWTYTWGEAQAATVNRLGDVVPAGAKTMENHFFFSNAKFRIGSAAEIPVNRVGGIAGFELGFSMRSTLYHLTQFDNIQVAGRAQRQAWVEGTITWGLTLRLSGMEFHYQGSVVQGSSRPGAFPPTIEFESLSSDGGGNILATPNGLASLGGVSVFTHQVSLSMPLGRLPAASNQP